jgi:hypothetical protein
MPAGDAGAARAGNTERTLCTTYFRIRFRRLCLSGWVVVPWFLGAWLALALARDIL